MEEKQSKQLVRLTDLQISRAKELYLNYVPVTEIARSLGCTRDSLQWHVSSKWRAEREAQELDVLREAAQGRTAKLNALVTDSTDILLASLRSIKQRGTPPSLTEARNCAHILEALDKILRLDKGSPTEILAETKPISIIELRKEVDLIDPFYEEEDKGAKKN